MRERIAKLGTTLGPDMLGQCRGLFDAEQTELAAVVPAAATDLAYGPHPRHRLDLYAPTGDGPWPVFVFVHGGGFVLGDKGSPECWANANVGRMAARAGFLGVVINYRLAPEFDWPAGSEDVAAVVDWIKTNVTDHGGDPAKLVLAGTSAGAVHVAGYLKLEQATPDDLRAIVLLSGLFGYTPLDDKDMRYYGSPALYPARMPRDAIAATGLPLFLACAEFDPPRFQREFLGLMQDRLARHGAMPRSYIASGHNHYSMAMHLGTSDTRLSGEVIQFIREVTAL
jgi:acetyl esterase/lipase